MMREREEKHESALADQTLVVPENTRHSFTPAPSSALLAAVGQTCTDCSTHTPNRKERGAVKQQEAKGLAASYYRHSVSPVDSLLGNQKSTGNRVISGSKLFLVVLNTLRAIMISWK